MSNAVLVADMVVGFLEPGHNLYCGDASRDIIPNLQHLIESEQAKGSRIFFMCDTHDLDDLEFKMFPPHCIRGGEEPEVIPELQEFADEVIPKRRYSAFFETNLDERHKKPQPAKIIVAGYCTNIRVLYTAAAARHRAHALQHPAELVTTCHPVAHQAEGS